MKKTEKRHIPGSDGNGSLTSAMSSFQRDESGATAVELGVIATVMGMMLISALGAINKEMKENYSAIQTAVEDVR